MYKVNQLLARLERVKQVGSGKWKACCPAHDDKSPSLGIKHTDDGKILIHCFSGCPVAEILAAIGLDMNDLYPDNPKYKKSSKPAKI